MSYFYFVYTSLFCILVIRGSSSSDAILSKPLHMLPRSNKLFCLQVNFGFLGGTKKKKKLPQKSTLLIQKQNQMGPSEQTCSIRAENSKFILFMSLDSFGAHSIINISTFQMYSVKIWTNQGFLSQPLLHELNKRELKRHCSLLYHYIFLYFTTFCNIVRHNTM